MIRGVGRETGQSYRMAGNQGAVEWSALTVARCRTVIHLAVGRFIRRPGEGGGGVGNT